MLELTCKNISIYMQSQLDMEEDDREVLQYGLHILLGYIIKGTFLILISLLFDVLTYSICLSATFALFRLLSGGVHCSTFKNCTITSLSMFLVPSILIKAISTTIDITTFKVLILIVSILSLYIIYKFAPIDNVNKHISTRLIKKINIFTFIAYILIISVLAYIGVNYSILLSSLIGLMLQSLLLTPIGYKLINIIDIKLIKIFN